MAMLAGKNEKRPPYAPPILKAGKLTIAQTANILFYLGPRLKLAVRRRSRPAMAAPVAAHRHRFRQGDPRHPSSARLGALLRRRQAGERRRFSENFLGNRAPKYLGYFEKVLKKSGGPWLLGRKFTYIDLSVFQLIEGLRYAFPKAMKRPEREVPGLVGVHDRVQKRPNIQNSVNPSGASHSTRAGFSGAIRSWTVRLRQPCAGSGLPSISTGFAEISRRRCTRDAAVVDPVCTVPRWTITSPAAGARSRRRGPCRSCSPSPPHSRGNRW